MTGFMYAVSFIGSAGFYLFLLVAAFWCLAPRAAATGGVALALSGVVNAVLKLVFADPRPYWIDPDVVARAAEPTFGMPSGHAQGAMVAWGFLAVCLTRRGRTVRLPGPPALRPGWVWAPVGVVIVLVGYSRVYLGVHSVGQVAAGWAVGAVLLVGVVRLEPVVVARWRALRPAWQVGLSAAVPLGLLACALVALVPLEDWRMPSPWQQAIILAGGHVHAPPDRLGLQQTLLAAGLLGGMLAGLSLLAHRGWFAVGGRPLRRAARLPVGLGGLAMINLILLPTGPHPVALFGTQALTGLWITVGAPEVFVRIRLARRPTPRLPRAGEPALTKDF